MTLELPEAWSIADLTRADLGAAGVWTTPSLISKIDECLSIPRLDIDAALSGNLDTLVVVGGGTMMDRAKADVREARRPQRLVLVPSIWGSGAEASPIVVLDQKGRKDIRVDPMYLPDQRVIWPELAESIPPLRAKEACGDCWAHALEGFFSPLASDELRAIIAEIIHEMLHLPLTNDARWFECSAKASAAQAHASVGLIHGIAHALEGPLRTASPHEGWHHARLCATFLLPVFELNQQGSDEAAERLQRHSLNPQVIRDRLLDLHDGAIYEATLELLQAHWCSVLRDRCTRTNCVLVRPKHLDFFLGWREQ